MNAYEAWLESEGLPKKERIRLLYEHQIRKYTAEEWGINIQIRREELSEHSILTKRDNINNLKKERHKIRYNLTRTKTLLSNLDKPPVLNYSI